MTRRAIALKSVPSGPANVSAASVLAAFSAPVIVIDEILTIQFVNPAAEQFFQTGAVTLMGLRLNDLLPSDSPIFGLIAAARHNRCSVSEIGIPIDTPKLGNHLISIQIAPMVDNPDLLVLVLNEMSLALKLDRHLTHRHAARSVTAMAAMLAHEVKNPLSGIKGAAQLLEQTADAGDRELTRLICDEADRICALVNRMDVFSDDRPLDRESVNIHEVLERARKAAKSGFARHVRFVEEYDPSLPLVLGNYDRLVQVFLNLMKNASEAVAAEGGEITLTTSFQHGIRLAVPGSDSRVHLPLVVTVQDNGSGIPEDLRAHLFDPFVTTKRNGTGLGLALVAKIIGDHGGMIEFDSQPRRTVFRVLLPMVPEMEQRR